MVLNLNYCPLCDVPSKSASRSACTIMCGELGSCVSWEPVRRGQFHIRSDDCPDYPEGLLCIKKEGGKRTVLVGSTVPCSSSVSGQCCRSPLLQSQLLIQLIDPTTTTHTQKLSLSSLPSQRAGMAQGSISGAWCWSLLYRRVAWHTDTLWRTKVT